MGVGLKLVGGIVSAEAQKDAAELQADVAAYNARVAEWSAAQALRTGEANAARISMQGTSTVAKAKAAAGGSGLDVGSFADAQATTRAMSAYDMAIAKRDALLESMGLKAQAYSFRKEKELAKTRGEAGYWGTLLSTAGSVASDVMPTIGKG